MSNIIPCYPNIYDHEFLKKLWSKKEFAEIYNIKHDFLYSHQIFVKRYLSPFTPYNNLLLFHNTGSGKTFSSIEVADQHRKRGKKIFVILKGDTSAHNFRLQLNKWCNKKNIDIADILPYYSIKRYIAFSNALRKMKDKDILDNYSNSFIIIDEVHNLRSNKDDKHATVYKQIWRLLHIIKDYKLLMLTATPMVDKYTEIYSMLNLMLNKHNQIDEKGMMSKEKLINLSRGRISFLNIKERMGKVIYSGTDEYNIDIKMVVSYMKDIQLKSYNSIKCEAEDHIYRNYVYCSLLSFGNGYYGPCAFSKYINKIKDIKLGYKYSFNNKAKLVINKENLYKYSCKYDKLLKIIEQSENMSIFVFCEEVRGTGLIMLGCIMELFGYELYNGGELTEKKKRYTIYTGNNIACPNPKERLDGFNSSKNRHGEYIKIFLGSKISGEGITLANVRQVHIMTPHWNNSIIKQAIGRANRNNSHILLPESERTVTVYRHVAMSNYDQKISPYNSIDLYKYKISRDKSLEVNIIEKILEENSISKYHDKQIDKKYSDISTYLLYYLKDVEDKILEDIVNIIKDKGSLLISELSKTLNLEYEIVLAALREKVYINNYQLIEDDGKISLTRNYKRTRKNISIHEFSKDIKCTNISKKLNINITNKIQLIDCIKYMSISEKSFLLEREIINKNYIVINFFSNSILYIRNTWYHILYYRSSDDNCSYGLMSQNYKPSGKTRFFNRDNNKWEYLEDCKENIILNTIIRKTKNIKNEYDKIYNIYGIFTLGDNRIRIRDLLSEKQDGNIIDARKVNRGRCISSYSLSYLRKILVYIYLNQLSELDKEDLLSMINIKEKDIFHYIPEQEVYLGTIRLNKNQIADCIKSNKYDFRFSYWIINITKSILIKYISYIFIKYDMYIVN